MKVKILAVVALLGLLISCKRQENEKIENYPSGKLWRKTVYSSLEQKDKNYRVYEFYEQGSPKSVRDFENGVLQGRSVNYYDNGKAKSMFYFNKGKLDCIARHYNEKSELTDKGLFINDSMVVKEEFFYKGNMLQINVFSKKGENFEQVGKLLYDTKGLFGLDNSFYYISSSLDSIKSGDSLKVNLSFIASHTKNAHLALTLGKLNEQLQFVTKDKIYKSDSLSLAFYYKPTRIGYNLILGKLYYITGAPEETTKELIFYHDFLAY
jgi:antitoxin component YwqK of YwqJK toxin-antitoxin module